MVTTSNVIQLSSRKFSSSALDYQPHAPASNKAKGTVVCLHGFPDNLHSFSELGPLLAQSGYRVIAPALRGYETASVVNSDEYYLTHMANDVLEWLPQCSDEPVHLIGHDWGGAIGSLVATQTELKSYTCLAIPPVKSFIPTMARYPQQLRYSWYMLFFQLRGFADKRFAKDDFAFIERLWRDWSPDWQYSAADLEAAKATFRQPGVAKATLDYYRCTLNVASKAWRKSQKAVSQPILAPSLYLDGKNDGCMANEFYKKAMDETQFLAGVSLELLPDCGHFLHREQPDVVAGRIISHLQANP